MNRINKEAYIFLEDCTSRADLSSLLFKNQIEEVVAWTLSELYEALAVLRAWQKKGFYVVGFVSYDAGLLFQDLVLTRTSTLPLLHFIAYQDMVKQSKQALLVSEKKQFELKNLVLQWTQQEYRHAFDEVRRHIEYGDTYQVNLTSQYHFDFQGDVRSLYQALREEQEVAYSGLLLFPDYQILTLSPELFFSKKGNKLKTKPMKGTIQRGATDALDDANKQWLLQDEKSKAENTMIVDLLRNDMSKISVPGSVVVSALLEIESYKTVHQMTSTIESDVAADIDFVTLLRALFPCGSITGAPKKRTMEIIQAVEAASRGLYTGTIGYILPNNDMCFSVAIRTLVIQNGRGELGLGGGIVYDSTANDEYDELKLKGKFFTGVMR